MAPADIPSVKFSDGSSVPILGLGTWKSKPGEVKAAVEAAISAGYRHIDCAPAYDNEAEVGEAIANKIKDGTVTRDQLFVVSKLWQTYHEPEVVEEGLRTTLKDLKLDYLDLYLIHFPVGFKQQSGSTSARDANNVIITTDRDYVDTWRAMEKLVEKKLVRSIGVSNFNEEQIDRILKNCSIKPATNQVECHPYLIQKSLSEYCNKNGIIFTAYSPFASPDRPWAKPDEPKLIEDPAIVAIAKKYNKTTAQILLRYQIQRGHVTIPKSVTPARIVQNAQIFDFKLSPEDVEAIEKLDRPDGRVCLLSFCKGHKYYPF
ncbi:aldo-keto reductase family 1 member B1-like [Neocloeon triangulifer]|uniref:aldo-keto reductase family 1 member B1-like n=1 Tax=Neocloeon triangulifer TaxID=2078957 RepID=UPI00286FA4B8|nr:aldo-keto reductase family 1 member B1-like [Neocloeon triangulifer]